MLLSPVLFAMRAFFGAVVISWKLVVRLSFWHAVFASWVCVGMAAKAIRS